MECTYQNDFCIGDLELEVTIRVKGEKKDRPSPTDEELKGNLIDVVA